MSSTDQDNISSSSFCSDEIVDKVKEQLDQLIEKNKDQIDHDDYRSLLNDTNLLKRYIKRKRNLVDLSAQFIFDALQWQKRHQINNFKDEKDFPREFFECGGLYLFGKDVDGKRIFSNKKLIEFKLFYFNFHLGNYVLHIRTKLYQKISQISDLLKKFTIFMMYKADRLSAEDNVGWVIVFDCTEAGIVSNCFKLMKIFTKLIIFIRKS